MVTLRILSVTVPDTKRSIQEKMITVPKKLLLLVIITFDNYYYELEPN